MSALRRGTTLLVVLFALGLLASTALAQDAEPIRAPEAGSEDAGLEDLFGDERFDDDELFGDEDSEAGEESEDTTERAVTAQEANAGSTNPSDADASQVSPVEDLASDAGAEGGGAPSLGIEEILVHGQAGTGVEVDAAVSVTSFGADDLEALGVSDVSDVAKFTPNLEIRTVGSTAGTFFIRGVGLNDFTANAAGAIAIYQDNVPLDLPAIQLGQLFDTENVEILRGPQGSGPNRNASGGSIRIHSQKPTGEYSGSLRASYGRFNEQDYVGALELPLMSDVLSARFSFRLRRRDPITTNRCGSAPPFGIARVVDRTQRRQPAYCGETLRVRFPNPSPQPGEPGQFEVGVLKGGLADDLSDINNWAARVQFRFVPADHDMDWLLNLHGGRIDQLPQAGQAIGTRGFVGGVVGAFGGNTITGYRAEEVVRQGDRIFRKLGGDPSNPDPALQAEAQRRLARRLAQNLDLKPFRGDYSRDGQETQNTIGASLTGNFGLDFAQLTWISGVEYYERNRNLDADYTSDNIFEFLIDDEAWQVSQELGLSGELDLLPLEWDVGAYFLLGKLAYDQKSVPSASLVTEVRSIYDQHTLSVGPYASFAWDFLDDFTLEGGARYNLERKGIDIDIVRTDFEVCVDHIVPETPSRPERNINRRPCSSDRTWDSVTGHVSLRYHFSEDVSAYAKYTRGWKAGQFSAGGASGDTFTVADPETIDAFEAGFSGGWFDDRLRVEAALFHYSYDNYQVFLAANNANSPPQRIVTNASDAVVYGAELEINVEPFEGFEYTSRFGWIESEFLDFTQEVFRVQMLGPGLPSIILPATIEWTGNRLPNTPRFKWSGTLEYSWQLGRFGELLPRWDYVWTDDVSFDASGGRGAPNLDGILFMPEHAVGQRAFWLHNLRIAYRTPSGGIEVSAYVRNVGNTLYKTLAFDASAGAQLVGNIVGDPRTYGVSVTLKF